MDRVVLDVDVFEVADVDKAFAGRHGVVFQLLACFLQSGDSRVGADRAVFQVFDPFVQWREGCFVELVHADQDVFREDFGGEAGDEDVAFARVDPQLVARMHADELVLPVVDVVRSRAEVEIEDADGVDFPDFFVVFSQRNMFGDGFGYAV